MKLRPTERFAQDYENLPERLQKQTDKALDFLLQNLRHPSLRAHRIRGTARYWEARVTREYRIIFTIEGDTYVLYGVGPHDIIDQFS